VAEAKGKKLFDGVVAVQETKGTYKYATAADGPVSVSIYVRKGEGVVGPKAVKVVVEEQV